MIKDDEVVNTLLSSIRLSQKFPISLIYFIALSEQCQFWWSEVPVGTTVSMLLLWLHFGKIPTELDVEQVQNIYFYFKKL
jgi:hypothetical protein